MSTYLTLSLDTRRAKKNGTYPIIFRLTHNTKTTSIKTGFFVKESDWDSKRRLVKSSYNGTESPARLNNLLNKKKSSLMDEIVKLQDRNQLRYLSVKQVKDKLTSPYSKVTFRIFTEKLIQELIASKRVGTARSYKGVLAVVTTFNKNHDITFTELNHDFLQRFETYHLSKPGNGKNGLAVYMRTIRAIFNKAIKADIIEKEAYPFDKYTIQTSKTRKRAISLEAIRKILNLNLNEDPRLKRDRNIFIMSFYLQGMPFTDMANLKLKNIVDGRLHYDRQKTSRPYDVKITEKLKEILEEFTEGKSSEDYILPIVKREEPLLRYKDIRWAILRYNKNLKEIARLAGINEKLTSYVARHTFATIADEMEIPVTGIRDMLGHDKISTTESYLSSLKKSKIDEYQDRVLGNI